MENALRNFSTLTQRDVIQINYNKKIYEIMVLEVKPIDSHSGISIVETDLEVKIDKKKILILSINF